MKSYRNISVVICLFTLNNCMAANIFFLSAVPSLSHSIWNQKFAKLLVDRNHTVTMLDVGWPTFNHTNFDHHTLYLRKYSDYFDMEIASESTSSEEQIDLLFHIMNSACKELLFLPETKTFLNKYKMQKQPFDLIINDGTCCESFLGFVKMFGSPPLILTSAFSTSTQLLEYAGLYDNPSYVPQALSAFPQNMNFFQRIANLYIYFKVYYNYHLSYIVEQNKMAKIFFGDNSIDVLEISRNSKILLMNTHPVLDGVKPYLPSIVTIAGLHIDEPKPLEKDLQVFLDNALDGAIYISFGSNLYCENMKQDKIDTFIKVFAVLKTKILWKCAMNITNLPPNVKLGKWFEQADILAHPKVKVFITHGGLLGSQEAIYHGVPMLILPFITDQHFNSQKLERLGVAIRLIYANLNAELLYDSLNKLLTNNCYQERITELSLLFRDNPIEPKNLTIFWIEHTLRHPETNILRSPTKDMSFYKIIMLDVAALLIAIFTVCSITIYLITVGIIKMFKGMRGKQKVN